jgi:4-hydroxybenzoate polyprenyltransferase
MKKIFDQIVKLIELAENSSISFLSWITSFFSLVLIRILIESWIDGFANKSASYVFYNITNTFVFFLLSYFIFLAFLNKFLKVSIKKLSSLMLWGYVIIIFPPIIDHIIFGDSRYLNFYGIYGLREMLDRFITFFGDSPDFGVTYGTRIEIALVILAISIYSYIKTREITKTLLASLFSYIILFVLATFPSWLTIIGRGLGKGFLNVTDLDIVRVFITPTRIFSKEIGDIANTLSIKLSLIYSLLILIFLIFGFWKKYKNKFLVFGKNIRPVQIVYHLGLFFIGIGLGYKFTGTSLDITIFNLLSLVNLSVAVIFSWITSVIINDIADKKIDLISNKDRPLVSGEFSKGEYFKIGVTLFVSAIVFAALVSAKIAMFLIVYQALAWVYSHKPFRLKRIPLVATFISALASLLVLFSGFMLIDPNSSIVDFPVSIIWLLLISFTLSLTVKDLKDIEGDKRDSVWTIPVLFGEYWGKIIIGTGIFVSYILSVLILREFALTFWACLLGSLSFWVVNISGRSSKISHRNVLWWIMGIVFVYIVILIKFIFI